MQGGKRCVMEHSHLHSTLIVHDLLQIAIAAGRHSNSWECRSLQANRSAAHPRGALLVFEKLSSDIWRACILQQCYSEM